MTEQEIDQLVALWIAGWEIEEKVERRSEEIDAISTVSDLQLDGDHATLWEFILAAYRKPMSDRVFAVLAAGPLEDLLADFGPSYIDRVEKLARQDPKFNELLGGVWKNSINEEVWERVGRIRNSVGDYDRFLNQANLKKEFVTFVSSFGALRVKKFFNTEAAKFGH